MKTIQQTTLRLTQGKTDTVYEVSLVELMSRNEQRYLVNTRHGKVDRAMRESTKTTSAVTLAEAKKRYLSVLVAKTNQGYHITQGFDPLNAGTSHLLIPAMKTQENAESGNENNEQQQQVLSRLMALSHQATLGADEQRRFWRTVWRCGELKLKAAASILQPLAFSESLDEIKAYSLAWALGRCGNEQATHALQILVQHQSVAVQRIARQALVQVSEAKQRHVLLQSASQALPPEWVAILNSEQNHRLSAIKDWFEQWQPMPRRAHRVKTNAVLYKTAELTLLYYYLLAIHQYPDWHELLLQWVTSLKINKNNAWIMRELFKMGEFQQDWALLAVIIKAIENSPVQAYNYQDAFFAFGRTTRDYFRRRSWRILRTLGRDGDADFTHAAMTLLLAYQDGESSAKTITKTRWERIDRHYQALEYTLHFDPFATHIAFNQLLYRHSQGRTVISSSCAWLVKERALDNTLRTEAFPALWNQAPQALLKLLSCSHCQAVHEVMIKALAENKVFCQQVTLIDWQPLLISAYESTAQFTLNYIQQYHHHAVKNLEFISGILNANTFLVREQARSWLGALDNAALLTEQAWLCQLILSPYEDNRLAAQAFHARTADNAFQQALLGILLVEVPLLVPTVPDYEAIIAHVRQTLREPLAAYLPTLSLSVAQTLLMHPQAGIQLMGAEILVAKGVSPRDIPQTLYQTLMQSEHEAVRAVAVRLLGNLSDAELANIPEILLGLLQSDTSFIRQEAQHIIARIAPKHPVLAQTLLQNLVSVLFAAELTQGMHADVVHCVTQSLNNAWDSVDKHLLWRLLQAKSHAAQQVGTALLPTRAPLIYSVKQWAHLGKHASLSVRQWVWQAYRNDTARIQTHFNDALGLFDTDWDDSRQFALDYFSQTFHPEDWSAEALILLCDNVRDDVQRLGRDLLMRFFVSEQGAEYLLKLSQHPSRNVQLFATQFLQQYAAEQPALQQQLKPYFITVLSAVNQGRVAKDRVLTFLLQQAFLHADSAALCAEIFTRQSVTIAIEDKAKLIAAMRDLQRQYPHLSLPLRTKPRAIRGYQPALQRDA